MFLIYFVYTLTTTSCEILHYALYYVPRTLLSLYWMFSVRNWTGVNWARTPC